MKKKITYLIILIFVVFFGGLVIKNKKTQKIDEFYNDKVVVTDVVKSVSVDAVLESDNYANISSEVPTTARKVYVDVGDDVQKGQKLALLDRDSIIAQINIQKLAVQRAELAEQDGRLKSRHLSKKQIQSLKKASEQARQKLNELYAQLRKLTITSPIDGVISFRNLNEGEVASGILFKIIDRDSFRIEAYVPEVDFQKFKEGTEVEVAFDAYPNIIKKGIVQYTEPEVIQKDGNTYLKTIINIRNISDITLLEGMNAEIVSKFKYKPNVVAVPREFAKKDSNGYFVHILDDGEIAKRYFKAGLVGDNFVEVLDGLTPNQEILIEK